MIPLQLANTIASEIKQQYKKVGIKVKLNPHEYFLDGDESQESSAYFNSQDLIHISTKDRDTNDWLLNLLHETCHADQMLENSSLWELTFINNIDMAHIAQLCIDRHIELSPTQITDVFLPLAVLELDAEKRTVQKIKKYDLRIYLNIKYYIQQAHAYAASYMVTSDSRVRAWIPAHKPPYEATGLVSQMADEFTPMSAVDCYKRYPSMFENFYPELFTNKNHVKRLCHTRNNAIEEWIHLT